MLFVNCPVKEKSPIETLIDTGANTDLITQKFINKLGLVHYVNESNCPELQTPDGSFSVLGKVELQTSFSRASSTNVDGKHISTDPVEFLVVGPDWHGPDLMLGKPWLQKMAQRLICMSQINVLDILPLLSLIAILTWFSIRLAKLNAELNARDANFTAEVQRILLLINSFTTRLDEIEQVLERYNNHFGRISSEFDSINESITTFQPLFNQHHAIIQRIEQDQQSETNLSEDSSNSHNSSINSSYSPNSSASSSSQQSFSGITLTIWTRFKQIFDRDMAQRRYTFDKMCYSVAMRIRELGGDIRSGSCKSSIMDQIGSWIDSME
nr:7158_t:CDS:2 [Entrophospora candida]